MELTTSTTDGVIQVLTETLGLDPARPLDASTPLFGSLPELDSMAVVEVIVALQQHFGVEIDEDDITAEAFASVSTLAELVNGKR